jgi:hypothetical protein
MFSIQMLDRNRFPLSLSMLMPIVFNQEDATLECKEKRRSRTGQIFRVSNESLVRWQVHITESYRSGVPITMPTVTIDEIPPIVEVS